MIPYEKYHGTGNDFVIVDASHHVPDRGAFATQVCDPERGVGADGVLFLALEERYTPSRIIMTLVQPDGGTAPMCGNGARCATRWAAARTGETQFMIDTQAGTRHAVVEGDRVAVEMGTPTFTPREVPLARDEPLIEEAVGGGDVPVTAVNTGVPHAVAFVDDVRAVDLATVAPAIRHADVFPQGANATFASRAEDGEGYDQRTFERGVEDETLSCGTGAVAIVAVARRLGRVDDDETIPIHPPGGDLEVSVDRQDRAHLSGPAAKEFDGEIEAEPVRTRER